MADCDAGMPPTHTVVSVNAHRVGVYQWGDAPRHVVLLHGITSNALAWWRVAPVIAALGYRVTAIDMPGHGVSDVLAAHDIPTIAAHIIATCAAIAVPCTHVIGHSWGGATALTMAQHTPIERLILIDPAVRANPIWGQQTIGRYSDGVGQPATHTIAGLRSRLPQWHECDIHWKALALQQCRYASVAGFFLESGSWDISPLMARTSAQTLCLVADTAATVIPLECQSVMRPACTRWVQLAGTDHNMYRGGYDVVMPHILAWLKGESHADTSTH